MKVNRSQLKRLTSSPAAIAAVITAARLLLGAFVSKVAISVIGAVSPPGDATAPGTNPLIGSFLHWDANWIMYISKGGYGDDIRLSPFFPVYPGLVHATHTVTGLSFERCALLVSGTSFFFAVWGLISLTSTLWPDRQAYRVGALLAFFPTSVFLMAGYCESTFLAAAVWSLTFVVRRRYWPAAVLAGVASATRPDGVLVGLAVFTALLIGRHYFKAVIAGAIAVSGLVLYSLFCWAHYGDPLQFAHVQEFWNREPALPFWTIIDSLRLIVFDDAFDANRTAVYLLDDAIGVAGVAALVWLVAAARRHRQLLPLVCVAVPYTLEFISNGPDGRSPESMGRLFMCVLPLFLVAAALKREWSWTVLISSCAMLAAIFGALFNLNYWLT